MCQPYVVNIGQVTTISHQKSSLHDNKRARKSMCFPLKKNSGPAYLIAEEFHYIPSIKEETTPSVRAVRTIRTSDIIKTWTKDAQCNLQFLHRCQTERLTGPDALAKCLEDYSVNGGKESCEVTFLVRASGIVVTEVVSRHFFRRFLPVETLSYCGLNTNDKNIFGVVIRQKGNNWCHVFSQLDEKQPSKAIVKFINEQFRLDVCF